MTEIEEGIIAAFEEELDQLYWEGYAEQLKDDDPMHYNILLEAFAELHG